MAEGLRQQAGKPGVPGRPLRSALVAAALTMLGLAAGFYLGSERSRPADDGAQNDGVLRGVPPAPPPVMFADVTAESGIDFVHASGAAGEKLLPETMGSGAAFFDYDQDGDPDLVLINGPGGPAGGRATPGLYRNDGRGSFEDVTVQAGLNVSLAGTGVAVGDYDGDGFADLFVAALGENRLFRNQAGTFRDVTTLAGVGGSATAWSTSAGFLDYDNDGDLDLFVCNYVQWSREIDLKLHFTLNGVDRAYGPPKLYRGTHSQLYRNDGRGRFTDVSAEAGIQIDNPATGEPMGKALALTFADVDRDGHIDIFVAHDTVPNFLFRNLGDGRFREVGMLSGVALDQTGLATSAMGVDIGDVSNDGRLEVGVGNFANENTSFYVQQADPWQFADVSETAGVGSPSRLKLSFGLFFFDYDLDGRLDLLQANGHLEDAIHDIQPSQTYRQPTQLFWNTRPGRHSRFTEVGEATTGDLSRPIVGRGAAYADIDNDGDLDVLLTQVDGAPLLVRNDQRLGHHWLRVRLRGSADNRDAIGARVTLTSGGQTQERQVMPTRSYLSQVELTLTFGLGPVDRVDGLHVSWPDGTQQDVRVEQVDTVLQVVQPG